MFESLSSSLQTVLRDLRGYGRLSEANIKDALRHVRLALLEADVNYQVAREFVDRVREKCLGADVVQSVTPGQQVVKHVQDELVALLGGSRRDFDLQAHPAAVMLLGLHGAGKTTTCAKLARRWKAEGRRVLVAACDIRRPAAVHQLKVLCEREGVDVIEPRPGESVPDIADRARDEAIRGRYTVLLLDTGGRFQIDEELVGELKEIQTRVRPRNRVLVLDAAIGQESVEVARRFHEEVQITGLILTKLDGDARGGAALSVVSVAQCPILAVGTGESAADLEPFHPDRMASRILGMGDVVSLVEKAQEKVDFEAAEDLEARMRKQTLDLDDFLSQLRMMKRMGPLRGLLDMLPGMDRIPEKAKAQLQNSDGDFRRIEAIICSMTPQERRTPRILNARRKQRVARGSGTEVREVNQLLRRFDDAQRMMKRMKQMQRQKGLRGRRR